MHLRFIESAFEPTQVDLRMPAGEVVNRDKPRARPKRNLLGSFGSGVAGSTAIRKRGELEIGGG